MFAVDKSVPHNDKYNRKSSCYVQISFSLQISPSHLSVLSVMYYIIIAYNNAILYNRNCGKCLLSKALM